MKKPIAIAAAVIALGAAGTAIAAPGGGVLGGDPEERQAEFASDLAQRLDGVNANQVEQGLEEVHAEREAEMLNQRAEGLAGQLDGVSVEQAKSALERVHETLKTEGTRPDPEQVDKQLADELGVSVEQIQKAHQAEQESRLDQAVEDGMLTEEQADQIREQIESGEGPVPGGGHPGPGGPGGAPGGPGAGYGPGLPPGESAPDAGV
ncbi:MAG: hypothetical protein JJE10_10680 [Thermoleophilia bacterium]|nr:hypothetical protein [Thermoleophilia bacterium]